MQTSSLRVLVLEDHPFLRAVAVNMLQRLGCAEVFQAAEGAEALAVLNEVGPVDIALCDLCMEGMDGLEFLQTVGHSSLVRSVIICSSLSEDLRFTVRQIVSLLNLELLGDLAKPLNYEAMERLLKKHSAVPRIEIVPEPPEWFPDDDLVCQAFANSEMQAYFQPKFNLRTGQATGVEVLARWPQASGKVLTPAYFMPALGRNGLMDELLYQQLHQSLALQQQLKTFGHDLNFAFNLQAAQLSSSPLVAQLQTLLRAYDTPASSVTFELTETGLLQAPDISLECLFRLRLLGCRLSIDDFGAGFSSLQRLCQLPFNEIKLDAEFVQSMLLGSRSRAVITSTLTLGETFGMSVVVEGIETDEQRQRLLEMGCTQGQGYWYAKPMSGHALCQWVEGGDLTSNPQIN